MQGTSALVVHEWQEIGGPEWRTKVEERFRHSPRDGRWTGKRGRMGKDESFQDFQGIPGLLRFQGCAV